MKFLRVLFALLLVNLSGTTQRLGSALTIVVGVTCAVGVLVSMLAMGTGAREQQTAGVRPDRVVLTTRGTVQGQGSITKQEAAVVNGLPGVRKDTKGDPIVVFQSMVPIEGRLRATGKRIYFPLVGVTAKMGELGSDLRFTAGRSFEPGLHELIASNACRRQFAGFELGDRRLIRGSDWTVVGLFDEGRAQNCVVQADAETVMSALNRTTYSSATLLLQAPADYERLRASVAGNPALKLDVQHEKDAVAVTFKPLNSILNFVSFFVGTIMA